MNSKQKIKELISYEDSVNDIFYDQIDAVDNPSEIDFLKTSFAHNEVVEILLSLLVEHHALFSLSIRSLDENDSIFDPNQNMEYILGESVGALVCMKRVLEKLVKIQEFKEHSEKIIYLYGETTRTLGRIEDES